MKSHAIVHFSRYFTFEYSSRIRYLEFDESRHNREGEYHRQDLCSLSETRIDLVWDHGANPRTYPLESVNPLKKDGNQQVSAAFWKRIENIKKPFHRG